MKWKNLGLALVGLVVSSWWLTGAGNSNPMAQPPSGRATEERGFPSSDAAYPSSGVQPFFPVPEALPCGDGLNEPVERGPVDRIQPPDGSGGVAQVSHLDPLAGRADRTPRPSSLLSDPSYGLGPTPPQEPDTMALPLLNRTGGFAGGDPFVAHGVPPPSPFLATRFGWWLVDLQGSPTKVAEYEGVRSSPFLDVDGLFTDRLRTVNLSASYLDNASSQVNLNYFGPRLSADVDFQRYPHRLVHDPLTNMGTLTSGEEVIREDLNVGENYAIRVEELRANFKSQLNENIKVRFNFWSQRKQGERQANAMLHCFGEVPTPPLPPPEPLAACHVLSQRQSIDWQTVKLEPAIEVKYGPIRAEYSRPMRFFGQDDQIVTRQYWEIGPHFPVERNYAFVPDTVAQTDRLKLGVDLGCQTDFYARLSAGNTEDKFRDTHRKYQAYNLRLTNRTCDGLTLTGYLTINRQANEFPPFFLPEEALELSVPNAWVPPYGIRHPIDYLETTAGAEASWYPFRSSDFAKGLSFTGGYEQGSLNRTFADYFIQDLHTFVTQEHTPVTSGHVGTRMRFSRDFDTYVRYKVLLVQDPLFGVNRYEGVTNTNLPEHENLVEVGGTWRPLKNLITNATFGVDSRTNHSDVANFDENSFPVTFTLWYAVTPAWSLSAGYGLYSNRIEQDILFPSDLAPAETWDRRRWGYGGRSRVLSLGTAYAWTEKITLSGGLELVSGKDLVDPLQPWPDLAGDIDVIVDRTRVTAGVDWLLRERVSAFFRYRFEQYTDETMTFNSGIVHMYLAGLSAVY